MYLKVQVKTQAGHMGNDAKCSLTNLEFPVTTHSKLICIYLHCWLFSDSGLRQDHTVQFATHANFKFSGSKLKPSKTLCSKLY